MKKLLALTLSIIYTSFCVAQTIENPVFDRTDAETLHINKVEVTQDTTFVYCSYSADGSSWANISNETYLLCYPSKEKHKIISCTGFPFDPDKRYFAYEEICDIIFRFPSIKGASHFDFIENPENKAFNIYGVSLNEYFDDKILETDINRLSNMSSFYDSMGDTVKAISFKNNEIKAVKYYFGRKTEPYLVELFELCEMLNKYEKHDEAIKQAEQVAKLIAEIYGTSNGTYALQLRTIAQYYSDANNYEMSIKTFKESIELFEKLNIVDEEYALALGFLSDDYNKSGDEKNSILYRQKSLETRRTLGNGELYLQDLMMLITGGGQDGNKEERLNIASKELNNIPDFVDTLSYDYISVIETMATGYENTDFIKAIAYCDKALSLLKKNESDNILRIAFIQGKKIRSKRWLGQWDEVIELGENVKNAFDSQEYRSTEYETLLEDLSWAYSQKYNYEVAIQYEKLRLALSEEKEDWIAIAESYSRIGDYYKYKEELDSAELYAKKAIELLNNHDNPEDYLRNNSEKTGIPYRYLQRSLGAIKMRIETDKSNIYQNIANIQFKKRKFEEAIKNQIIAGNINQEMDYNDYNMVHYNILSQYYCENGQFKESYDCAKKCIMLIEKEKDSRKFSSLKSMALMQIANVSFKMGDINQAINFAKEADNISDFSDFMTNKFNSLFLLSYLYKKNEEYNHAETALSQALDYLKNIIPEKIAGMTTEQKQRLWSIYDYQFFTYREIVEKTNWNRDFNSKLFNYTLFSKSLLLDSEYSNDIQSVKKRMGINWKDIQRKLSEQDIAIEFITTREDSIYSTYHALVIDKKCTYPNMITLYHESEFEKTKKNSSKPVLEILGNLIWKPILKQYNKIKNIYFSPEGAMHIMPIEYCNVEGIGEMMEHFNIYRLSSTKELVFIKPEKQNNKAILYGGLDYNMLTNELNNNNNDEATSILRSINARGGVDPLPNTLEEIQEISTLLNDNNIETTLYTGENGTEDSFKNLSGKDISMIHLSTHGMYVNLSNLGQKKKDSNYDFIKMINNEKDPVKEDIMLTHSFLVMSGGNKLPHREQIAAGENDGILTASEISHIDLHKINLVVLSACESGLGSVTHDGIYGLQRGFKKAGANSILMSLDKVDDEATKILMVEFYKNLMNGKSKYQSLKDAQKYLRQIDNGKYDDPRYWASFILLDGIN